MSDKTDDWESANRLAAPWSAAQVDALNRFQRTGYFHPFTCVNYHDGADRTLFATQRGWICPHCDYTQDWAHPFMMEPVEIERPIYKVHP